MKITRQQLSSVVMGKRAVTSEIALRFEQAFGGSADMWLRMQVAYDLAQARRRQGKLNIPRLVQQPSQWAVIQYTACRSLPGVSNSKYDTHWCEPEASRSTC